MKGLDEARILGRVPEREPQTLDRGIEGVLEVDEGAFGPQAHAELVARNHIARTFQEQGQDLKRLILQVDTKPGLPELACPEIDFEIRKAHRNRRWLHVRPGSHSGPSSPVRDSLQDRSKSGPRTIHFRSRQSRSPTNYLRVTSASLRHPPVGPTVDPWPAPF